MTTEDFSPIWEFGTIPLKTVAAFSQAAQTCPSPLLGSAGTDLVRFEIPNYQRGLVWKKSKKKSFLNSLTRGWPTGAIVMTRIGSREIGDGTGRREFTWHIIDGQQRLTTYFQFREGFWSEPWFIESETIRQSLIKLAETLGGTLVDMSAALTLLTQGDTKLPFSIEILDESSTFLARFCKILGVEYPAESEELRHEKAIAACKEIRTELISQKSALDEIPIAIITISPKLESSPREAKGVSSAIFSVLNSGIPLSKYDLLAAKWSLHTVKWNKFMSSTVARSGDSNLLVSDAQKKYMLKLMKNRIESSYKDFLEDVEMDEASVEDLNEEEVSLFDFFYSLSKSTQKYATRVISGDEFTPAERLSFPTGASSATIGFDTCALLFSGALGPSGIENLEDTFPLHDGEFDIALVAEHYFEAAKEIDHKLSLFTRNSAKNKKRSTLGTIQASVYIASYINSVYDVNIGEDDILSIKPRGGTRVRTSDGNHNLTSNQRKTSFRANISAWWLLDTLSDVFQGSDAYQKAGQRVWSSFETVERGEKIRIRSVAENDALLYQPELSEFMSIFRNLFVKEFKVTQAPIQRSPSQSALAFFHAVYKDLNYDLAAYDMDHVVAFRAARNATQVRLDQPIPLNHVANWMPLSPNLNRSRGNIPWAVYFNTLSGVDAQSVRKEMLIESNHFVENLIHDPKKFGEVLCMRYALMVDKALKNVGLIEYVELSESNKREVLTSLIREVATSLDLEIEQGTLDTVIYQGQF